MVLMDYTAFINTHREVFRPFGLRRVKASRTARILFAMAHDVTRDEATGSTAAMRNLMLYFTEIRYDMMNVTNAHLADPMGRLDLFKIEGADAPRQYRWLVALNLRQLKEWHTKGLGDFSNQIERLSDEVTHMFTPGEIAELELFQTAQDDQAKYDGVDALTRAAAGSVAVLSVISSIGYWNG